MKVLCVDDEKLMLKRMVSLCRKTAGISETIGFSTSRKALSWLEGHSCDLAILGISQEVDGIQLARRIREIRPDTDVVFVTGYPQYAVDAWAIHARGYLIKPISPERLQEEVTHIQSIRSKKTAGDSPAYRP